MKFLTHSVRVPPLTDVTEMVACYHTLMSIQGVIVGELVFEPKSEFTHPIESEKVKMVAEFMGTMSILTSSIHLYGTLTLTQTLVQSSQLFFTFSYNE